MERPMSVWKQVSEIVEGFMREVRELPVSFGARPEVIRREVESRFDFGAAMPLQEVTARVADLLQQYAVHVTHPRYFGLFNPSVSEAAIVADTLVALYNPQLATWSHSPAASEIERATLKYFTRALGLGDDAGANFTTGGLEANL